MTRYDIINRFISQRGYRSFLEIGTARGEAFHAVRCERKVSVDPDPRTPATFHLTSDNFFLKCNEMFDIVFIDGLHECHQVYRDIMNSLGVLNPSGMIVMHDCHPTTERMQEYVENFTGGYEWTGDVWKAFVYARSTLPYEMYVLDYDWGCGIIDTSIIRKPATGLPNDMDSITYADFVAHPEWMNFRR